MFKTPVKTMRIHILDEVVVVQHENEGGFDLVQLVGQCPREDGERPLGGRLEQGLCVGASFKKDGLDDGQQVGQEETHVIIIRIERQSSAIPVACFQPTAD